MTFGPQSPGVTQGRLPDGAASVTSFPATPTIFSMLLNIKTLDQYDLSALRTITNAAAALSVEHIRCLREKFPQALFYSNSYSKILLLGRVLSNIQRDESGRIAAYYAQKRAIPDDQILHVKVDAVDEIPRERFMNEIARVATNGNWVRRMVKISAGSRGARRPQSR